MDFFRRHFLMVRTHTQAMLQAEGISFDYVDTCPLPADVCKVLETQQNSLIGTVMR